MADETGNRNAFLIQKHYCDANGAPIYARMCAAIAAGLTRNSAVGARILDWPGEPTRDALPLRLFGGLHALVLAEKDEGLAGVYSGAEGDEAAIIGIIEAVLADHGAFLMPWLDGPPQTNEPGRSGALICGLMEVARRHGPKIDLLEIGSSAGLNLMIDRYAFDLGGTAIGPAGSPVMIRPEWRGDPPAAVPIDFVSVRGSDIAPMDATDPAIEARLAAYVWPETPERLVRMRHAAQMMRERGVSLVRADAADWIEARLAEPQDAGVTRVLMHSVVWQYLPEAVAERIRVAVAAAGVRATPERPLGWVAMEPDREIGEQIVSVRTWPGDDGRQMIATAQAHAAWVRPGPPTGDGARSPLASSDLLVRL